MKNSILEDYRGELAYAKQMKADGVTNVQAEVAGKVLAAGRNYIPIDEYIKHWEDGITAMVDGAAQALFNY